MMRQLGFIGTGNMGGALARAAALDAENALLLANRHAEKAQRGRTNLYTKIEFDPWKEDFERELNRAGIAWRLNSAQYEEDTGFWHFEWIWAVRYA